jgi:hypothetical protein
MLVSVLIHVLLTLHQRASQSNLLGRSASGSMSFVLLSNVSSGTSRANATTYRANALPHREDSGRASRSTAQEDIQTWHRRLGHLNLSDVRKLLPKESYSENATVSTACDICIKAKAKEKFQRKIPARRASKPLKLIHSDLCGPISPQSRSGRRYYILYIDDFSRYT